MKIFGFEITRNKPPVEDPSLTDVTVNLADAPIAVEKVSMPTGKLPALIPKLRSSAYTYMTERGSGRGVFACPEYDLVQIGRIEDTESYVRQAFKKKIGLMFKEGFDLSGPDKKTVRYIKVRLSQIAMASGIPTASLMRSIGSGLIKKSNAFLLKVRKTEASGGRVRVLKTGRELQPVAAYFILPPETMEVDADEYGNIRKWRQMMPGGDYKDFRPDDIIHFKFDAKEGFIWGTPTIIPVIDDIRALRKIEENIELLVYQHLFPLFHYKVGTETAPAGITETGEREIDVVKREIQFMPSEGGIVTPERHEIKMIGAEGRALRAEGYLDHFKKRVFAGLGVSAVDMGEGETANRATADNMSRALIDDVKDFQDIMEMQFNEFIIKELLLESTFGDEVLNEEHLVQLKFHEIDIDKRIKLETHAADMYMKHGTTHDELRISQGKEPLQIPDGTEATDDPKAFPDWSKTFWKLIEEPKALIQAMDEPYSAASKAAAENKATAVDPQQLKAAGAEKLATEKALIKAKPKPAARKDSLTDHVLTGMYSDLEENVVFNAMNSNKTYASGVIRAQAMRMIETLSIAATAAFIKGYTDNTRRDMSPARMSASRAAIRQRATKYISRLSTSLIDALGRNIDTIAPNDKISLVRSVFSSLKYRTDLIADVEIRKAYNYGKVLAYRESGIPQVEFGMNAECAKCSEIGPILDTDQITLDDVPPFHGNCGCSVKRRV